MFWVIDCGQGPGLGVNLQQVEMTLPIGGKKCCFKGGKMPFYSELSKTSGHLFGQWVIQLFPPRCPTIWGRLCLCRSATCLVNVVVQSFGISEDIQGSLAPTLQLAILQGIEKNTVVEHSIYSCRHGAALICKTATSNPWHLVGREFNHAGDALRLQNCQGADDMNLAWRAGFELFPREAPKYNTN